MKDQASISGYSYPDEVQSHAHQYLLPTVTEVLRRFFASRIDEKPRLFDVGCGNGSVAAYFASLGYEVSGVDPSCSGIEQAKRAYPKLNLELGSAYDRLVDSYGTWPALVSLEVVEHVYFPKDYASTLFDLLAPRGIAIVSTPYHGYLKNIALSVSGRLDAHYTALWDHGHIKFWSIDTLSRLLCGAGFEIIQVERVGRIKSLAKSMILVARKPCPT